MTNQELLQIALQQSAIDCNCKPEDFLQNENIVTESRKHPSARSYHLPVIWFPMEIILWHRCEKI